MDSGSGMTCQWRQQGPAEKPVVASAASGICVVNGARVAMKAAAQQLQAIPILEGT